MRWIALAVAAWLTILGLQQAPTFTEFAVAALAVVIAVRLLVRTWFVAGRRRRFDRNAALRARTAAPVHTLYPVPLPAAASPDEIDLRLLQCYWTSRRIGDAASASGIDRDEAQARLITLLLDADGVPICRRPEAPVLQAERRTILDRWESGVPLVELAARVQRSPWGVAAVLLEQPDPSAPRSQSLNGLRLAG